MAECMASVTRPTRVAVGACALTTFAKTKSAMAGKTAAIFVRMFPPCAPISAGFHNRSLFPGNFREVRVLLPRLSSRLAVRTFPEFCSILLGRFHQLNPVSIQVIQLGHMLAIAEHVGFNLAK